MLLTTACGGGNDASGGDVTIATVQPGDGGTQATPPPGSKQPATNGTPQLSGFAYPIAGGCLPKGDQLMPNANRAYRNGIHEGVDFYAVDNCNTNIGKDTPVVATKAGRVVRADTDYTDLTPAGLNQVNADPTSAQSLDTFRGRQVWIDHGNGVVSRYAHLNRIADGIRSGVQVTSGQLIAYVGESGTPESVSNPGHEYHLNWELRIGAGCAAATASQVSNCSFLGQGLPAAEVRRLYTTLFSP